MYPIVRWRVPRGPLRDLCTLAVLTPSLWTAIGEWRLHALPFRGPAEPGEHERLVIHWNVTPTPSARAWAGAMQSLPFHDPIDLLVITNPWHDRRWRDLPDWANLPRRHRAGRFAIYAKHPVRSLGWTTLRLEAPGRTDASVDHGEAWTVQVDHPDGVMTVLVIDLPANPAIHRGRIARDARAVLDEARSQSPALWPTPELVVGDLNIPRDSHSIRVLFPGMTNAYRQGGVGHAGTWPARTPALHLDHAMVAPTLRARRYDIMKLPWSTHRAQRVVLNVPTE